MLSEKHFADPLGCWQQIQKQDQQKLLKKLLKGKKQQIALRPRDPIITQLYIGWQEDKTRRKHIKTQTNLAQKSYKFGESFHDKEFLTQKKYGSQFPNSKSNSTFKKVGKLESGRVSDFLNYRKEGQSPEAKEQAKMNRTNSHHIETDKMRKKLIGVVEKVYKDRQEHNTSTEKNMNKKHGSTKNNLTKKLKLQKLKNSTNPLKQPKHQWTKINILQLQTYFSKLLHQNSLHPTLSSSHFRESSPSHIHLPKRQKIPDYIRDYKSLSPQIDLDALFKLPTFKILIDEESLYFGSTLNEKRDGLGIYVCKNYRFEGNWKNDEKIEGYQITTTGHYKGKFKNGLRHGQGEFCWRNGEKYQGEWRAGVKQGSGIWKSGKGDSYIGQWSHGKVQGYGVHISSNGQRYQGNFKEFLKNGFGKETFPNGDIYQGNYRAGKPYGQGKYTWKNQIIYEGQFVEGYRHGKGTLKAQNYMKFTGSFVGDKVEGKGQIQYNNGDLFIGEFKQGKKYGKGTMRYKNNHRIITGIWKNDQLQEDDPNSSI